MNEKELNKGWNEIVESVMSDVAGDKRDLLVVEKRYSHFKQTIDNYINEMKKSKREYYAKLHTLADEMPLKKMERIDKENQLDAELQEWIEEIDCAKDTYEIMVIDWAKSMLFNTKIVKSLGFSAKKDSTLLNFVYDETKSVVGKYKNDNFHEFCQLFMRYLRFVNATKDLK